MKITLDKSIDGRCWTIVGVLTETIALRLRFTHTSYIEPSGMVAEVGMWNEQDDDVTWAPVTERFMFAVGAPDLDPSAEWIDDLLMVWRREFEQLARALAEITHVLDLGPAWAEPDPPPASEAKRHE